MGKVCKFFGKHFLCENDSIVTMKQFVSADFKGHKNITGSAKKR